MKVVLHKPIKSSFLSCKKDTEIILKKLFQEFPEHSNKLKKLLVINTKDCLEDKKEYDDIVSEYSVRRLFKEGYIRNTPKIRMPEHEEVKSYILISFDNFVESGNPQFRDCTVSFDIICHIDQWDLEDFDLRPLAIAGYIDGLLDDEKLTGIGTFQFLGCNELILNEELAGYTLTFSAVHGSDDQIPPKDE